MPEIVKGKYKWSKRDLELIEELYPITPNNEIASILNVSKRTVIRKARELELEKHPRFRELLDFTEYGKVAATHPKSIATRWKKGERVSPETEFKKGHTPWIKGTTLLERLNYQTQKRFKLETCNSKL